MEEPCAGLQGEGRDGATSGGVYYEHRTVSVEDLALMRPIDEVHLERLYAGSRMLQDLLHLMGIRVGRRAVRNLMRRMGTEALYRKPDTCRKHPERAVYPYLPRHPRIERPNQVWA